RRTVSDKRRARLRAQRFDKLFAVKRADVGVKLKLIRLPDFPARMFDAVFATAAAKTGVAPVMFGDEFRVRAGGNRLRLADSAHLERFPFSPPAPGICNAQVCIEMIDLMFHWQGDVVFAVKRACDERDRAFWNQFANEDDAAPPHVGRFLADGESQVHFLEVAMKRNWQSEHARIEK